MSTTSQRPAHILPVIVISQFAGTSLWFAGNAILPDLASTQDLPATVIGQITSAVQLGFILGTLIFAFFLISDRFSPTLVFLSSALLASLSNSLILILEPNFVVILISRFLTGFFLAGIYPVGMKIAAGWYKHGLGKALGYLVGALVFGTAFPHLLSSGEYSFSWQNVVLSVSVIASLGGLLLFFLVPVGPFNTSAGKFDPKALIRLFRNVNFRAAASGYFGHMWELYTFWAFVPIFLGAQANNNLDTSFASFVIICSGGFSCIIGGLVAVKSGSSRVAFSSLFISGLCCLLFPFAIELSSALYMAFLVIWGFSVISDSPQFSSMVAKNADPKFVGSGLTIINSLGFALTILSISLFELSWLEFEKWATYLLLPGPVIGLIGMRRLLRK